MTDVTKTDPTIKPKYIRNYSALLEEGVKRDSSVPFRRVLRIVLPMCEACISEDSL